MLAACRARDYGSPSPAAKPRAQGGKPANGTVLQYHYEDEVMARLVETRGGGGAGRQI